MEEERGPRRVVGLVIFDTEAQHHLQSRCRWGCRRGAPGCRRSYAPPRTSHQPSSWKSSSVSPSCTPAHQPGGGGGGRGSSCSTRTFETTGGGCRLGTRGCGLGTRGCRLGTRGGRPVGAPTPGASPPPSARRRRPRTRRAHGSAQGTARRRASCGVRRRAAGGEGLRGGAEAGGCRGGVQRMLRVQSAEQGKGAEQGCGGGHEGRGGCRGRARRVPGRGAEGARRACPTRCTLAP